MYPLSYEEIKVPLRVTSEGSLHGFYQGLGSGAVLRSPEAVLSTYIFVRLLEGLPLRVAFIRVWGLGLSPKGPK